MVDPTTPDPQQPAIHDDVSQTSDLISACTHLSDALDAADVAHDLGNFMIVVVDVPADLSRLVLYRALDEQVGRWGRSAEDRSAIIDLSNHSAMPAQTLIGGLAQSWEDLAYGLAQELTGTTVLVVIGLEQMLHDTPHRLASFLEARARSQVVVVLTCQAAQCCQLPIRRTTVRLDQRLLKNRALDHLASSEADSLIRALTAGTIGGTGGADHPGDSRFGGQS